MLLFCVTYLVKMAELLNLIEILRSFFFFFAFLFSSFFFFFFFAFLFSGLLVIVLLLTFQELHGEKKVV